MTNRQLVMDVIAHKNTPSVPYYVDFCAEQRSKMAAHLGDADFERAYDYSLNVMEYGAGWAEEIRKDYFRDHFGVVWNRSGADKEIGVIDHPLITDIENIDYAFPKPDESRFLAELDAFIARGQDRFKFAGIGFSMFERAWTLLSMPDALIAMVDSPRALDALLDRICDFNLRVLDIILTRSVDGVLFGDDWGQQRGLIMGAPHWRRFIGPRVKRMYEKVKRAGKVVAQHSCGDIGEIFPDLIDMGLDVYQTFQPEIYDIEKVKRDFGGQLTFWGGISTQRLLPYASPDFVKSETIRILRTMSRGGGYIAGPTHQVPADVPPENLCAMLDVFVNQDKYLK